MPMPLTRPRPSLGLVVAILLAGGCAAPAPKTDWQVPVDDATAAGAAARRWYSTCFRFTDRAQGRPEWALDLLVADRVAGPALEAHAGDIALWRFHRRAAPDPAGHQFTLLAFTSPDTADALRARFEADPTLARLREAGWLGAVLHGCRADQAKPAPGATSDPAWDASIQASWPWFIMGVSASWLELVRAIARDIPPDEADPLPGYRAIDARIERLWADQGQHAYLHHLSAVFGYRPLKIETWMRY